MANPTPGAETGADFPDAPPQQEPMADQDQPDLDAFAAKFGLRDADDNSDRSNDDISMGERLSGVSSRVASIVSTGLNRAADRIGRLASTDDEDEITLAHLVERARDIRTVMVTTMDERGTLSARPLTVQEIDEDGDLAFIVDRDAEWVTQAVEPINVAFVDGARTWISVAGRTSLDDDRAALDELWDPMTDAFFPSGKDDGPIVLRVLSDRWEYWTAPNRAAQLIEIARAKFGDGTTDLGDSGSIET